LKAQKGTVVAQGWSRDNVSAISSIQLHCAGRPQQLRWYEFILNQGLLLAACFPRRYPDFFIENAKVSEAYMGLLVTGGTSCAKVQVYEVRQNSLAARVMWNLEQQVARDENKKNVDL
jgi:hypothetical protein